jgi:hypothetical protein
MVFIATVFQLSTKSFFCHPMIFLRNVFLPIILHSLSFCRPMVFLFRQTIFPIFAFGSFGWLRSPDPRPGLRPLDHTANIRPLDTCNLPPFTKSCTRHRLCIQYWKLDNFLPIKGCFKMLWNYLKFAKNRWRLGLRPRPRWGTEVPQTPCYSLSSKFLNTSNIRDWNLNTLCCGNLPINITWCKRSK